ncbi:MAG: nitrite reductase small subunit NirD [Hyphomonadaceae bacterium]|nr:nitrite reductase small subunit NirD [Hyphomonadaceae bacterium]
MTTETWIDLCGLADIPLRGARRVKLDEDEIAIFRTASNTIYAINNRCPHKGGPLSEGIVHDTGVTCPLHALIIDLETGQARGADTGCVRTYPVEVRENQRVFLKASAG